MINIRKNIFETNSSSTHSITLSDEDNNDILGTIVPDGAGIIRLAGGSFGWEWFKSNDPLDKANYCLVDCRSHPDLINILVEVIKEHTGADAVDVSAILDKANYCYVDHQSQGTTLNLFENKNLLKNFIFNPKCWMFTGNDNSSAPPNFYDVSDNIKYKYKLTMDGAEDPYLFREMPDKEELIDAFHSLLERHMLCSRSYNTYPNDGYEYSFWEGTDRNGVSTNSLSKIDDGIIVLFRFNYTDNSVVKSTELHFELERLPE